MADHCEHCLGKVSDVTRQLIERDRAGRAKYGTTLDRTDLAHTDWLQHLSEELLDAAGYALAAKREALARQEAAAYSLDEDPAGIRDRASAAIIGALAFGSQNVNPPPEGHWLQQFWGIGRAEAELRATCSAPVGQEPRRFHNASWKEGADLRSQGYMRMLTQTWATADSTELKNACEAGVLAILGSAAPPSAPVEQEIAGWEIYSETGRYVTYAKTESQRDAQLFRGDDGELPEWKAIAVYAAQTAAQAIDQWLPIETAPKSVVDGSRIDGIYLLGFVPDVDALDPASCIDVIWWEPLLSNARGGRGKWVANRFGDACEVTPTHWRLLPVPPIDQQAGKGATNG